MITIDTTPFDYIDQLIQKVNDMSDEDPKRIELREKTGDNLRKTIHELEKELAKMKKARNEFYNKTDYHTTRYRDILGLPYDKQTFITLVNQILEASRTDPENIYYKLSIDIRGWSDKAEHLIWSGNDPEKIWSDLKGAKEFEIETYWNDPETDDAGCDNHGITYHDGHLNAYGVRTQK